MSVSICPTCGRRLAVPAVKPCGGDIVHFKIPTRYQGVEAQRGNSGALAYFSTLIENLRSGSWPRACPQDAIRIRILREPFTEH